MTAQPWLPVTEGQALRFFFEHLRDIADGRAAPESELLYNASVLAHFATTSTAAIDFPSAPVSLGTVFDLFVLDRSETVDPDILEAAASQCLLLTGFFGAQLAHRYNLRWYARLGAGFFERAARLGAAAHGEGAASAGVAGHRHGEGAGVLGQGHGEGAGVPDHRHGEGAGVLDHRHGEGAGVLDHRHGEGAGVPDHRHGEGAGYAGARAVMMHNMAARFAYWRRQQARLAKELHDLPKLVGKVH